VRILGGGGVECVLEYLFRRIIIGIVTVFVIISVVFFALRAIPGDPAEVWLGDYATPELIELTRAKWGLDKPIWSQYATYVRNLLGGDLGDSLRTRIPVVKLLIRHYPFTVRLMFCATLLSIMIAIPIGIVAAVRQNSLIDMFVMTFSFLFISMPDFWLGLMVLFTFSLRLGWFPTMGGEAAGNYLTYFSYLALPSICLGVRHAGLLSRMVRSTMIDTLSKDYISVARSKGLSEHVIRYKHALRNALSPIVSLIGVSLVLALAGAVIIEVVYSRPGLGRLYVNAVAARDYPLIQGCVLIIATGVVVINMLVDISYGTIDPRVRHE
jgi:ABC-type dipeptide/oligopeptide/nickel transport system permease component